MSIKKRIGFVSSKSDSTPLCNIASIIHRGQAAATIKRIGSNGGYGVRDGYRGQTCAIIKRTVSNGGHGIGNGYRGQTAATRERIVPDGGHGISQNIVCDLAAEYVLQVR